MALGGLTNLLNEFPVLFMQAFNIYDLYYQWADAGVFSFVLPFLLIFAVIFGILSTTGILGGHRGVNLIIALVIGLLALQWDFVGIFFSELFPRFAIGLAVLIVVVILAALFIDDKSLKGWLIGFSIAGAVIGVLVIIFTFNTTTYWFDSFFWQEYWGLIVGAIILVIVIIAIFTTAKPRPEPKDVTIPLGPIRKMIGG